MRIREDRPLEETGPYDKHYEDAIHIDIIGIACRTFWNKLYPHYGEPDLLAQVSFDKEAREGRLGYLEQTALFENIRDRELSVVVGMANPFSDFARIRTQEERNEALRHDVLNGIELSALMARDLKEFPKDPRWKIRGSLHVMLYDKNPYMSIFRAVYDGRKHNHLALGFLLQDRFGFTSPQAIIKDVGEDARLFLAVSEHARKLTDEETGAHLLFRWDHSGLKFERDYTKSCPYTHDVFLCHNSSDKEQVKIIANKLRMNDIIPWLDEWELGPGHLWQEDLENAIKQVGCVAIFAGRDGPGPWQAMEIGLSLNMCAKKGVEIIPVVLKDVDDAPKWPAFLDNYQRVDFRGAKAVGDPKWNDAMEKLVGAVRSYKKR